MTQQFHYRAYIQRTETSVKRNLPSHLQSNTTHNNQEMETAHLSIDE
jgi:hypothetical protein